MPHPTDEQQTNRIFNRDRLLLEVHETLVLNRDNAAIEADVARIVGQALQLGIVTEDLLFEDIDERRTDRVKTFDTSDKTIEILEEALCANGQRQPSRAVIDYIFKNAKLSCRTAPDSLRTIAKSYVELGDQDAADAAIADCSEMYRRGCNATKLQELADEPFITASQRRAVLRNLIDIETPVAQQYIDELADYYSNLTEPFSSQQDCDDAIAFFKAAIRTHSQITVARDVIDKVQEFIPLKYRGTSKSPVESLKDELVCEAISTDQIDALNTTNIDYVIRSPRAFHLRMNKLRNHLQEKAQSGEMTQQEALEQQFEILSKQYIGREAHKTTVINGIIHRGFRLPDYRIQLIDDIAQFGTPADYQKFLDLHPKNRSGANIHRQFLSYYARSVTAHNKPDIFLDLMTEITKLNDAEDIIVQFAKKAIDENDSQLLQALLSKRMKSTTSHEIEEYWLAHTLETTEPLQVIADPSLPTAARIRKVLDIIQEGTFDVPSDMLMDVIGQAELGEIAAFDSYDLTKIAMLRDNVELYKLITQHLKARDRKHLLPFAHIKGNEWLIPLLDLMGPQERVDYIANAATYGIEIPYPNA